MKFINKKTLAATVFAIVIVACFFIHKPTHQQSATQKLLSQFTAYAKQTQKQWYVPGMAIAIVHGNKIIYAKGFGKRNAKGQPVTPNTIFDIASLTKSFTAALLGMQIDSGKYQWNTKVLALLPKFKLYSPATTKEFEVRDLIAHDSGLPADALDTLGNFGYSTQHTLYALRFVKPIAPFRSSFAYQDVFLAVAKNIIQQASGETFTKNINQKIFKPLEMTRSFIRTEPALKDETNVAQPFLLTYKLVNYPYPASSPYLSKAWALDIGLAGGGIHSTAIDIAKWLIFNINNGEYHGQRLLAEKTMRFIHTPKTTIKKSKTGQVTLAYGEGWFINMKAYKPYTMLYHSGGGTGMHALMSYIPQEKLGIVILTNQYTSRLPMVLTRWFYDMFIYGKLKKNYNQLYLQQREEAIKQAEAANKASDNCAVSSQADLQQYVGIYFNPVYGKLRISRDGRGKLLLHIGPQNIQWQLTACRKHTLKAYWPNPSDMPVPMLGSGRDLIHFKTTERGKVSGMFIPYLNNAGNGFFALRGTKRY